MSWNETSVRLKYETDASRISPETLLENPEHHALYDEELALKNFNANCAGCCASRMTLMSSLENMLKQEVEIPDKVISADRYREKYRSLAESELEKIKPRH